MPVKNNKYRLPRPLDPSPPQGASQGNSNMTPKDIALYKHQWYLYHKHMAKYKTAIKPVFLPVTEDMVNLFFMGGELHTNFHVISHIVSPNLAMLKDDDDIPWAVKLHVYLQQEATAQALLQDDHAIRQWIIERPTATILNIGYADIFNKNWVLPRNQPPGTTRNYFDNIKKFIRAFKEKAKTVASCLGLGSLDDWLKAHNFFVVTIPVMNNIPFNDLQNATINHNNYFRIRRDQIKMASVFPDTRAYLYDKWNLIYVTLAQPSVKFIGNTHNYDDDSTIEYMLALRRLFHLACCSDCIVALVRSPVQLGTAQEHRH